MQIIMENPLGFSKEVAALLTGLGCSNLTQFRKKDIGLEDIKYLSDEDLIVLEVDDKFDLKTFKSMCASMRKKNHIDKAPKPRDIIKILQNEQIQLQLFDIYLKILYKILSESKEDFILDKNKNMKASQGLMLACRSVSKKLDELRDTVSKNSENRSNKMIYVIIAGGISLLVTMYILR